MTAHQQPHWFLWLSGLTCKTEPLAFPSPPPSLLHQPAPLAGKLSEGLFSRMGSENSALFVLAAASFPVEEAGCPEDRGWASWGPCGGGWWGLGVSWYGSLSNGVRGQLQQGGCQRGRHVVESHLCAFCYRDVGIFAFPSLAMDGTEIRIHQLHDLSQL